VPPSGLILFSNHIPALTRWAHPNVALTGSFTERPNTHGKVVHHFIHKWCMISPVGRTNINIDDGLIRQARRLTRLKTKRQIVDKALELLVRSESRKGILRYYGSGVWKGDLKASRRNCV